MKHLTTLCLTFCILSVVTAQKPGFTIFAGPQITSALYKINGEKQSTSSRTGFVLGAGLKIPFDNKLYFAPAAFYSLKGYEVKLNQPSFPPDSFAVDNATRIHTFELAFLLQYDFSTKPGHFFIKGGPSLDFQLAGKEKFHRTNGNATDRNMKFSFGDYGHYAASMLLHVGYETKNGIWIAGQYTHGLGSINNADHGPRIVHRVYGLTIGKFLNRRPQG